MTLKRSTPLRSRSYLKRKKRINHKRRTPRRSERVRDRAYLLRVKELPCCLSLMGVCSGQVEAHHAGRRPGMGMKASDTTAIPLCSAHHQALHDVIGTKAARPWADKAIAATQATLGYERRAA